MKIDSETNIITETEIYEAPVPVPTGRYEADSPQRGLANFETAIDAARWVADGDAFVMSNDFGWGDELVTRYGAGGSMGRVYDRRALDQFA